MLLIILLSVGAVALAKEKKPKEKKPFVLYATMLETTPVQLADGSKWQMDKGDTFPVIMFKEQQTKVILQLAGTSFMIQTDLVRTFEGKDLTEEQLATYRNNVNNYLESRAEKMKTELSK